jgi:F0F1-type ATP synthase assembly protein I
MDLLRERRETNRGLGDALAQAFDVAATTAIFFFFGWLLDRWLGTKPLFMIMLTLLCLIAKLYLMLTTYNEKMKRLEAERTETVRAQAQGRSQAKTATQARSRTRSGEAR